MTDSVRLSDGPPLPEMREAVLSSGDVLALLADLQAHTRIQGVLCKSGAHQQTPTGETPLEQAVDQLVNRTVTAIQIRYAYDDHEWTDTLLNSPAGVRLVRCQHQ